MIGHIRATIEFNQQGVVGQIVFTELDNGSIQVNTSFEPGRFTSWHVHPFPVDYTDDPATRCSRVGPHYDPSGRKQAAGANYPALCNTTAPNNCEAGDLAGKFGDLMEGNFSFIDNDPELQLSGRYSIIGRSIVIHPPGHGHLSCGNIHLDEDDNPELYVANFRGPTVGGSIHFRESEHEPDIGVFIYATLYYTNTATTGTTTNHTWGIYTDTPSVSCPLTHSMQYTCTSSSVSIWKLKVTVAARGRHLNNHMASIKTSINLFTYPSDSQWLLNGFCV